jgi:tetratricopeptide (TPR) repeat protein
MSSSSELGGEAGLEKGASLGRYVVLGLLGRGGMGEVYAAYDPELDRKIAVKLLRAHQGLETGAEGRTRLLREAQAIARLSHPNVVVVYDVGTFKESVFIAMEFVEGNTIGYWLTAADRPWRQVLDVYLAAGRGLEAAHAAGLVHRDFKPENVMLTRTGQVRVMDFGLARVQGDTEAAPDPAEAAARAAALAATLVDLSDATVKIGGARPGAPNIGTSSSHYLGLKLTQTGAILGTPAYMSPEQFGGQGGDARSDQFSFCVALYEGLYGRRPFEGDKPTTLMANVVTGNVTEPPADTRVPGWIRRVLLRGLGTKPEDRFPSMTDLLAALARDPAVRRRRWLGAAAGAVFVAGSALGAARLGAGHHTVCAGGPARAATAWGPERREALAGAFNKSGNRNAAAVLAAVEQQLDHYVGRWEAMYLDSCEATHVRGEQSAEVLDLRMTCLDERLSSVRALGEVLAAADKTTVDNAASAVSALPTLERCADVAMLKAVVKPPDDPAKRAEVAKLQPGAAKLAVLASAGLCNEAKQIGPPLLDRTRVLGYQPLEAEVALAFGRMGDKCIDPAASLTYDEEAVLAAEASNDDDAAIRASNYLAWLYGDRLANPAQSGFWVRHAEALLSRFPNHPALEAETTEERAIWLGAEGRNAEALAESRRSLALQSRSGDPLNLNAADTMTAIIQRLAALGRYEEAITVGEQAVALYSKLAGPHSGGVAITLVDESEALAGSGRFAEARAAADRALAIWRENNAAPAFIGYGLLDRGRAELAAGQVKQARGDLEQAVTTLGEADGSPEARFALAQALWPSARDRPRALALAGEARTTFGKTPATAKQLKEVDAWLEARRSP